MVVLAVGESSGLIRAGRAIPEGRFCKAVTGVDEGEPPGNVLVVSVDFAITGVCGWRGCGVLILSRGAPVIEGFAGGDAGLPRIIAEGVDGVGFKPELEGGLPGFGDRGF